MKLKDLLPSDIYTFGPPCKARRVLSPRKSDVPAVPDDDGQPAILPVSICMPDLVVDNVVASGGLPSVIAPPRDTASSSGKFGRMMMCFAPARACMPGSRARLSEKCC